jgi:hypothetical protein
MRFVLGRSAVRCIRLIKLFIDRNINRFKARLGNFLIVGDDHLIASRK